MDQTEVINLAKQYADSVIREYPAEKIILFGSHAKGSAHRESDIDIAVVVDHIAGDYLKSLTRLYQLAEEIHVMIEPVLIGRDEYRGGFLQEIMRTGVLIYEHSSTSAYIK